MQVVEAAAAGVRDRRGAVRRQAAALAAATLDRAGRARLHRRLGLSFPSSAPAALQAEWVGAWEALAAADAVRLNDEHGLQALRGLAAASEGAADWAARRAALLSLACLPPPSPPTCLLSVFRLSLLHKHCLSQAFSVFFDPELLLTGQICSSGV